MHPSSYALVKSLLLRRVYFAHTSTYCDRSETWYQRYIYSEHPVRGQGGPFWSHLHSSLCVGYVLALWCLWAASVLPRCCLCAASVLLPLLALLAATGDYRLGSGRRAARLSMDGGGLTSMGRVGPVFKRSRRDGPPMGSVRACPDRPISAPARAGDRPRLPPPPGLPRPSSRARHVSNSPGVGVRGGLPGSLESWFV